MEVPNYQMTSHSFTNFFRNSRSAYTYFLITLRNPPLIIDTAAPTTQAPVITIPPLITNIPTNNSTNNNQQGDNKGDEDSRRKLIIGLSIGAVVLLLILLVGFCIIYRKRLGCDICFEIVCEAIMDDD